MDYLDPKKKKAHKNRILIGYGLFSVVIAIATVILVYVANGYYIDRSTGEVIQNGLVYIDAQPVAADVYVNGTKQRGTTDIRLVIPSNTYTIDLKRDKYRDWSRSFILDGGNLRKLTYARLIPNDLVPVEAAVLRADPTQVSQSIDKKWLVSSFKESPLRISILNTEQPTYSITDFEIPASLVTNPTDGVFEVQEWASNNRHFLATYTVGQEVTYLLIDRADPKATRNLNIQFNDKTLEIGLLDRSKDSFFIYDSESKKLSKANIDKGVEQTPLLTDILAFKTYAQNWVLYLKQSDQDGYVTAYFKNGNKEIKLKDLRESPQYYLQLAKSGDAPVIGISSPTENRAIVYNNPEQYLNDNKEATIPVATAVLRVVQPLGLSISADASVILAYGKENMASHEFEEDRSYNFKNEVAMADTYEIEWLDGRHFTYNAGGMHYIEDFDGSNRYELFKSPTNLHVMSDRDFDNFVYLVPATTTADGSISPAKFMTASTLAE